MSVRLPINDTSMVKPVVIKVLYFDKPWAWREPAVGFFDGAIEYY